MKKVKLNTIIKFINKHIIIILCIIIIVFILFLLRNNIFDFINKNLIEKMTNGEDKEDLNNIEYVYDLSGNESQEGSNEIGSVIRTVNMKIKEKIDNMNINNIKLSFYYYLVFHH